MGKKLKSVQDETFIKETVSTQGKVKTVGMKILWQQAKDVVQQFWGKIKSAPYQDILRKVVNRAKKIDVKKIKPADILQTISVLCRKFWARINFAVWKKRIKNLSRWISDFWKTVAVSAFIFFFCYYFIGSQIVENIDVKTQYELKNTDISSFETGDCMAFLIKREVDDKMWTPNVPIIFPAYVLDNMPNFQMGVIAAVKDVVSVVRKFEQNTPLQQKDIQKAYKMLLYSPKVWLMSHKSAFLLAPSSNSQYRKAARELRKYVKDGSFTPKVEDLNSLLNKMRQVILTLVRQNEEHQQEKSVQMWDTKADDLFYFAKGYAFSLWQVNKVIASDFKPIILQKDMYADWTYMVSSLRKAAEFQPSVVRNGQISALTAPNHLMIQNYYLLRAVVNIENVSRILLKEDHDD